MDQATMNTILNYVQANYMSLIAGAAVVWVSLIVLRTLLRAVMGVWGWIGSYIVGAIPGALMYAIDYYVFHVKPDEATVQAAVAALLVGMIGQVIGRR